MSSQLQYHPTALERAYASHLLQTYFDTPHNPHDNTPVRISGRQAVPFLTTSGVDRALLRLFWTVTDPEGVGTLFTRNQFHVLLRLVAMAQAHFLPPLTTSTATNGGTMMTDEEKIEVLKREIINNSHLVVALPTFNADTSCPSVAFLMGTYPSLSTTTHHQGNNSIGGGGDNYYQRNNGNTVDVSNMLTNHDLQYQLWQKQQQQGQQQQQPQHDNTTKGGELHMMSVSDAFGSLPEVEDRPLPSLQMTSPPPVVEDVKSLPNSAMENDVNGMVVASLEGERNSNTEDLNNNKANVNDNDEDFGDFDSSNDVPLQTETVVEGGMGSEGKQNVPSATSFAAIVEDNDEADFGGFESTQFPQNDNKNSSTYDDDVKTESSADDNDTDTGFGDFSDSFPPMPAAVVDVPDNNNDNALSNADMTTESSPEIAIGSATATLSISDAFGALVNQEEDPPIQFSGDVNNNVVTSNENGEEDDFGNFDSADDVTSAPEKTHNAEIIPSDNNEKASSFGMSAFDAFGDIEDKPLPPLGGLPSDYDKTERSEVEAKDDSFGFGSFEVSVETEPNANDAPVDDSFGTFEDAAGTALATRGEVEDSFGTFEGATAATTPVIEPNADSQVEDSFGTFEGAETTEEDIIGAPQTEAPTISSDMPPTMSLSDAFGSLPVVEDLPLPPLQSPPFDEKKSVEPPVEEEADFGEFDSGFGEVDSDQPNVEAAQQAAATDMDEDDFGDFETDETNTRLTGLDTASHIQKDDTENIKEMEPSEDADFGAFGESSLTQVVHDVEPSESAENGNAGTVPFAAENNAQIGENDGMNLSSQDKTDSSSFGMSAFDAFGDIEDAPLPPLNSFASNLNEVDSSKTEAMVNSDDVFGAFEGTDSTTGVTNADAPLEDSFGTFEGAVAATAYTQPNEEAPAEDSFGAFEDAAKEAAQTKSSEQAVEDSFGTFEGAAEDFAGAEPNEKSSLEDTNEGVEEAIQNIALQPEVPAVSSDFPPTLSLSDALGSLPEIENLPLPPLQSPPLEERKLDDVNEAVESTPDAGNDDFGDFSSIPAPDVGAVSEEPRHESNGMDDTDDFGDFETSATPQVQSTEEQISNGADDANREHRSNEPQVHTDGSDDFGDFGEAQAPAPFADTAAVDTDDAVSSNNAADTEDNFGFGDWGSGDWQVQAPTTGEAPVIADAPDGSNGFDAFSEPAAKLVEETADLHTTPAPAPKIEESDEDFGSFEEHKSNVTQDEGSEGFVFVENTESNSHFDVFGDFSSPTSESFSAFDAADDEKIMQPKLEEDETDGFGDFSSFEDGAQQPVQAIGENGKNSPSRQELIGDEYTKRLERWASIVSTVKSDVERGQKIMDYISKALPASDRAIIVKSSKLRNHILGLAEFVRIVRCIAVTIADVFCLRENIDLKPSHLPEWNNNPIIADAIAIETLWSEISSRVFDLDILSRHPPQLESVFDIRSVASVSNVTQKADLCHLTLQPFAQKTCTQSAVDWNGNKYMACAANFLVNRMS
jgi:hypothetical protein